MSDLVIWIGVGLGGALGAVLRAVCTDFIKARIKGDFPWQTIAVNLVACFAIGVVAHLTWGDMLITMLCVGVLGGFSTLSTMCYEAVSFFLQKRYGRCLAYLALTYGSCLLATAAGFALTGAL